jgi:hypothetical protein
MAWRRMTHYSIGLIQNQRAASIAKHHSIGKAMIHQYGTYDHFIVPPVVTEAIYLWHKVKNYKKQDKKRGRIWLTKDYVNPTWIEAQMQKQNYKCAICKGPLKISADDHCITSNVTVDRIDNQLAHTRGNCKLSCHKCNGGGVRTH